MHKDYFGNQIEVGDIILRNNNSTFQVHKVLRLSKSRVGVTRMSWQNKLGTPLYVEYLTCINLSKMDMSQVQDCITKFKQENQ